MTNSIRWRLPLSYGAIALLASVLLGAVLLFSIKGYYRNLERDYLQRKAAESALIFSISREGSADQAK